MAIQRLSLLLQIREGARCEEHLLVRVVDGFTSAGAGHEALAALAESLQADDLLFLDYRDRALMQAGGVTPLEMAREYLAIGTSSAVGAAWGFRVTGSETRRSVPHKGGVPRVAGIAL